VGRAVAKMFLVVVRVLLWCSEWFFAGRYAIASWFLDNSGWF